LGGGFWLVTGGYGAVVADFKNYIVVIEGPQNDMRAERIIAEAKRLVPNKPIRYVINTHAHFDHVGGLRAFVAEGATIVTHQGNKGYYEKIFANPHTLVPDKLSQMKPQPKTKVEYVGDHKVMTDGVHSIEMDRVQGSTHNAFMLMVYLPKQKVLIEADEFNVPNQVATAPPAAINSYQTNLLANVERLKLDVDRIIPIHLPGDNRKVALSELKMSAGKT
jgi:glyoxylase-like metal-dependent hydrolase (beta-lactamase superfamily II)